MCLTYSLQFFVPIQIMLPFVNKTLDAYCRPSIIELLFRTLMVLITCKSHILRVDAEISYIQFLFSVFIAVMVPHLNVFISLIGALCSTALALFFPAMIQIVLSCGTPDGASAFLWVKNGLIMLFALFGLTTGTYESVRELIIIFKSEN